MSSDINFTPNNSNLNVIHKSIVLPIGILQNNDLARIVRSKLIYVSLSLTPHINRFAYKNAHIHHRKDTVTTESRFLLWL